MASRDYSEIPPVDPPVPDPRRAVAREKLADYAHAAWCGWMDYLFSKCTVNGDGTLTIPAEYVARWKRQIATAYQDLPENEKHSDRIEADNMLAIIEGEC